MTSHFLRSWDVLAAAAIASPFVFLVVVFCLSRQPRRQTPREAWLDGGDAYGWTPNGLDYPKGLDSYLTPRDL